MKKKRTKHSQKNKTIKNKKRRSSEKSFSSGPPTDEEFLDTLTASLSDKLEDVKNILDASDFLSNTSTKPGSTVFNTNESTSPSKDEDNLSKNTFNTNHTFPSEDENSSNSKSTATTSEGPSGYHYAGETSPPYRFGFTNSEFIAFLASLNAIEYIIVLSLITVLIMISLNKKEREVIYNFFITIGQTMGSGVDQTAFQEELKSQKEDAEKDNALQKDFDYIYTEMNALQDEIRQLKEQLKTSSS